MQIKKKGKQTLMFHNSKNIILFWIIFMGRVEALYNSQPINEKGGEEAVFLPEEINSETLAAESLDTKTAKQNQPNRSKQKGQHQNKKH